MYVFGKYFSLYQQSSSKYYLYFLISAVIAQIFNPIAELVAPIGIPTKEGKAEMETHPGIVELKKRKCLI